MNADKIYRMSFLHFLFTVSHASLQEVEISSVQRDTAVQRYIVCLLSCIFGNKCVLLEDVNKIE